MDPNNNRYSDDIPGMSARHFYVLDFLSRKVRFENKKVIDFACKEVYLKQQNTLK